MSISDVSNIKHEIKALALDLDGVVYKGNCVVPGAPETIRCIRAHNIKVFFVTNNSAKKREHIVSKLQNMGIDARVEDIFTSAFAAMFLLKKLCYKEKKKVLIVGSDNLKEKIASFSITVVDDVPCDILVVGFDNRFNYEKLAKSLNALRQGATFVVCNRDRTFPIEDHQVLPGCGPIVAAIEYAWGAQPHYEVGKPNTMLLEIIADKYHLKANEILVVGDMIDTDIVMSKKFGAPSILINDSKEYIENSLEMYEDYYPDIILPNIKDLIPLFARRNIK